MTKIGRPSEMEEWLKPEKLALIQNWRRDGLNIVQVAKMIGISESGFRKWRDRDSRFDAALKVGKLEAISLIENRFFQNALKSQKTADQIGWLKYNNRDKYYEELPRQSQQDDAQEKAIDKFIESLNTSLEYEVDFENNIDELPGDINGR